MGIATKVFPGSVELIRSAKVTTIHGEIMCTVQRSHTLELELESLNLEADLAREGLEVASDELRSHLGCPAMHSGRFQVTTSTMDL